MRVHLAWDCIDTVESSSRTMNIYSFPLQLGLSSGRILNRLMLKCTMV